MRQITKFLMVLALIALPMGFTSCDTEDDYYPPYSSLVTEAVQNYWRAYPGGTDYYTTREWFLYYYPMATAAELADFMDAVNYDYVDNYNPSNNDPLLNEVQMLSGEWAGNMTIAFDKNGDIYIKYTKSGTIFRMDAKSSQKGFHLGYESQKGYDTFFGYGVSTNTTDEFYIDLARQATNNAKAKILKAYTTTNNIGNYVFGNATRNYNSLNSAKAIDGLRAR